MLNKFELDPQVIEFAKKVSIILDCVESKEIEITQFSEELNKLSNYKNKALTLGFLFTHMTFYKQDLKTPWVLSELIEIIKANPAMLDIIPKQN